MAYRRDIDGLRAVAVLAVVLYHAGIGVFSGGFVGVDVFFVISGYLICAIILDDLRHDRFSIVTFYERRVRRIFPALFAMLAATGGAAAWLFLPREMGEFGRSVVAATLFISNFFFHQTSDYFAGAAHLKPLLHTWSLSVEEQFYLVFPVAMWGIARYGGGRWAVWLVPALLVSLALAVWGAYARPQATFYLAPTRAWELLIGALLATGAVPRTTRRWVNEALGFAGLGLIAIAVVGYSEATVFPGAAALPPCLGAALLIYSGQGKGTHAATFLGLRPMVRVGLVSYSLYLWHWPVLVLARHAEGGLLTPVETALALAASAVLAWASWRFIECPFRAGASRPARGRLFGAATGVMALAVACGAMAHVSAGWPSRFRDYHPPQIAGRADLDEGGCFLRPDQTLSAYPGVERCRSGGPTVERIVVWGDSFAAHLVPGLKGELGDELSLVQINASGCPPVLGLGMARRPNCQAFNAAALELIERERPALVVLAARWEAYLGRWIGPQDIQGTVDRLQRNGAAVLLVGQSPSFDFDSPYDYAYRTGRSEALINFDLALNAGLARVRHATSFDPMPLLCRERRCPLKEGDAFLFFDGGHLASAGSAKVAAALMPLLKRALAERVPAVSAVSGPSAPAGQAGSSY